MISKQQKARWTVEGKQLLTAYRRSKLALGEFLAKVRKALTGLEYDEIGSSGITQKEWTEWLETIRLSRENAGRLIRAVKNAKKTYTPEVYREARRLGMDIGSVTMSRPHGRYTNVIKKTGVPRTASALKGVHAAYEAQKREPRSKPSTEYLVERAANDVFGYASQIPEDKQLEFVAAVTEMVLEKLRAAKEQKRRDEETKSLSGKWCTDCYLNKRPYIQAQKFSDDGDPLCTPCFNSRNHEKQIGDVIQASAAI